MARNGEPDAPRFAFRLCESAQDAWRVFGRFPTMRVDFFIRSPSRAVEAGQQFDIDLLGLALECRAHAAGAFGPVFGESPPPYGQDVIFVALFAVDDPAGRAKGGLET